ncbi:MAG: RsmD family RNA methyltransferase, partial [Victivallaceae bacterium]
MQIIAGTARSIILTVPKGLAVRPTSVRARKALFDSLGSLSGLKVVDFFAGSGALGLEAASRGASEVAFVENARLHCQVIEGNIAKVIKAGASESLKVTCSNVAGCFFPALMKNPDIIFA